MKRKLRVMMLIILIMITAVIMPQAASAATRVIGTRDSTMYFQYYSSGWRNMDTPQHFVVGTSPEEVAYCVAHSKSSPSHGGSSYSDVDVLDNYSLTTGIGLQIILEQGYPFDTSGLNADEARYATANAIRFWLSEREYYEGGTDYFYNYTDFHQYSDADLRSMAAGGQIGSKIRTRSGYNNGVLQFAIELLIKARNQVVLPQNVYFSSPTLDLSISGGNFVGSTTVTLENCKRYNLNSSLPGGSAIYGYTGNNGDVLTFYIPISAANAGVSYGISADGLDDRTRSNIFVNRPTSSSLQPVIVSELYIREVTSSNMTLKTPAMPDLTVSNLVPSKSSYEPGETVTVTATISNYGNGAVGSAQVALAPNGLSTQTKTIGYLGAWQSTNVTYTFTAPNYTKDTNIPMVATVDPYNAIAELDESNNQRSASIMVKAALPDLVVQTLTTDKTVYEVGETVTVRASVSNYGYSTAGASTLQITPNGMAPMTATIPALSSGATSAVQTFTFTAPEVMSDTQIKITAMADAGGVVKELNESNNSRDTMIMVLALKPDLTFGNGSTLISSYYAGRDLVLAVQVRNLTAQSVPSADVQLKLGNTTVTESICVPGNGTNIVVFRATAPQTVGTYPVLLTIDPLNKIPERAPNGENNNKSNENGSIRYDGSSGSVRTSVAELVRNNMPDPADTEMESDHEMRGKTVPALPGLGSNSSHTWTEYRYVSGSYVQRSYWAELVTSFSITPDPRVYIKDHPDLVESGFGVYVTATTRVNTNYDHPEKLVSPQMFWVFYPETGYWDDPKWYRFADALELESGTIGAISTNRWQYPVSPYSVTNSRLHYTPVWFPDGMYEAVGQAFYGWSPAGQLYTQSSDSVEIQGNMYERFPVLNW